MAAYACIHSEADRVEETKMIVAAIRAAMSDVEQQSLAVDKLPHVIKVFDLICSPAGYRLVRSHKEFAAVIERKIKELVDAACDLKERKPEAALACDEVIRSMNKTISRCGAILRGKYDFRPMLNAPKYYHEEF